MSNTFTVPAITQDITLPYPPTGALYDAVKALGGLEVHFSAEQWDSAYDRLTVRDIVKPSRFWQGLGRGSFAPQVNGHDAVTCFVNGTKEPLARMCSNYALPESYTIYALFRVDDFVGNNPVIVNEDVSGNRLFAYIGTAGGGRMALDHGAGNGTAFIATPFVVGETYICAWSYDRASTTTTFFKNSITSIGFSGTVSVSHKRGSPVCIGSNQGSGGGNAFTDVLVFNEAHGGNAAAVTAVMNYLADRGGVTLT